MPNKNKIIAQVHRYIHRGQWDKAIKELLKIVTEDPSDVRSLLKLGDVYAKKGDNENASKVYRQVAESYSDQGFFLKAVAVYKQILKYDTDHLDVVLRLAVLYEHLGLTSEAMSQYQIAAEIHNRAGDTDAALDVLRRMVDLDPENVALRIKLAESISAAKKTKEAAVEFEAAADILRKQNRIEDYLKVAERLVFHDPTRHDVLKELAKLYLSRSDPKRALTKLQICFKADEKDVDTLNLLAQAFSDLGQQQKTLFVYQELFRIHESRGQRREAEDVRRKIQRMGLSTEAPSPNASQSLSPAGQHRASQPSGVYAVPGSRTEPTPEAKAELEAALNYGLNALPFFQEGQAPAKSETVPAPPPNPEPKTSISLQMQQAPKRLPDGEIDGVEKLLTEADVYLKYNLKEKALQNVYEALKIDSASLPALEKLLTIQQALGHNDKAADAAAQIYQLQATHGDAQSAEAARVRLAKIQPDHPLLRGSSSDDDENISIDISEDSGIFEPEEMGLELDFEDAIEATDDLESDEEVEFQSEDLIEVVPSSIIDPLSPETLASSDMGMIHFDDDMADTGFELSPGPEEVEAIESIESIEALDDENTSIELTPKPLTLEQLERSASLEPLDPALVSEALDGNLQPPSPADKPADGDFDLSEAWQPVFPSESEVTLSPSDSDHPFANISGDLAEATGLLMDNLFDSPADLGDPGAGSEPIEDVDDDVEEVEFLIETGLVDEARQQLEDILRRSPGHARASELLASLRVDGANFSADLLANMTDTPPDDGMSAEDHYDQGMLFKDLGRLDDAIRELKHAATSGERAAAALEMLGGCYVEMGEYERAVDYFSEALKQVEQGPAVTNLKYELGNACEASGHFRQATEWFRACAADDPSHRDVQSRLDALASGQSEAFDEQGFSERESTSTKISYL